MFADWNLASWSLEYLKCILEMLNFLLNLDLEWNLDDGWVDREFWNKQEVLWLQK